MLFVVAGSISRLYCLPSSVMLVHVVFQSTWVFYCLHSLLDFDVSCCDRKQCLILLFVFDA